LLPKKVGPSIYPNTVTPPRHCIQVPKRGINGWTEKMHIYFILVGQHGIARDFYYQLSLLLALYVLLSLSLSISLSFCLYLSHSLPPPCSPSLSR